MSDDAHTGRTGSGPARTENTAGERRTAPCAFPGCTAAVEVPAVPGRPAIYCGTGTVGPDHRTYRHDKKGRFQWRRKYGDETPEQAAARVAQDASDAAHSSPASRTPPEVPVTASLAGLTVSEQAQEIARRLETVQTELPTLVETLAAALLRAGDADAAREEIDEAQRAARRQIAEGEDRVHAAEKAVRQAQTELAQESAGRQEADEIAEDALQQVESAQAAQRQAEEAERAARSEVETARAETERARKLAAAEVEKAQQAADADAVQVRADRDRILQERQGEFDEQLRQVRAQAANEIEQARTQAVRDVDAARRDAHEADQKRARAEQSAEDAKQQIEWLRNQLSSEQEAHHEALNQVRADADRLRDELDEARDRTTALLARWQTETAPNASRELTEAEAASPWDQVLPAPLVDQLRALADFGALPSSTKTGINADLARRLRYIHTGAQGNGWSTANFVEDVLRKVRTAPVQRQLHERSPELAAVLARAKELATRWMAGDGLDDEISGGDEHDQ